jgi:hypothetical protein
MPKKIQHPTNIIQIFLSDLVGDHSQFVPARHFYKRTGIKQKRWGQIYRNDKSPTIEELTNLAGYFEKKITVTTEKRQLTIFNEKN